MIIFDCVSLNRKDKAIFTDLNLTVKKNEKILIRGKSGIGKTTLFKILLGFETIDKGKVTVNGNPIDKQNIKQIRKQMFYLSQDIDLRQEKVGDLLDEILLHNSKEDAKSSQLNERLSLLDLTVNILEKNVMALSGGERQRVGLLICFLLDRPVWLLDEPTSSLDDLMKLRIADYILNQNKTIVIISHDEVWEKNNTIRIERWQ